MRLIDADAFKQQIAAYVVQNNIVPEKGNTLCEAIDKQPTAYDVDKVVEQFERGKYINVGSDTVGERNCISITEAVEIVRKGGVG